MRTIFGLILALVLAASPALAALTAGNAFITVQNNVVSITGQLTVPNGGTGAATLTAHGVLLGNGTSAVAATAAGTAGTPFLSGGAGADGAYGALDLSATANTTAAALPISRGGTNSTAALTGSKCIRSSGGALVEAAGDCATAITPRLAMGSFTILTTSQTCYMNPGVGTDCADEGNVQLKLNAAATFANLVCINNAIQGVGNNVVVTGRKGTCASTSDTSQIATITGSAAADQSGTDTTNTVAATTGQCVSWKIVTPATLTASAVVNCTVEQTA